MSYFSNPENYTTIDGASGRTRTANKARLMLATDRQARKEGGVVTGHSYVARFSMTMELASAAGLVPGERVSLDVSPAHRACRIRKSVPGERGYKLTRTASKENPRLIFKVTLAPPVPSIAVPEACYDIRVSGAGIEFKIPDAASMEENLREKADG